MKFVSFIPCDRLKPFISSIAVHEAAEENSYRILPGTNIVLGFQFRGRLSLIHDGSDIALSPAGITGLTDRHKVFRNSSNIGTVLVYFRETGASGFFRQPMHELFRESISLDNLLLRSELLVVEDCLCEAGTDAQRVRVVEDFLISQMTVAQPDKMITAALGFIQAANGNIRISNLAKHLNTSRSPLEKRFRQTVGTTAKKFASIVRMNHLLGRLKSQQSVTDLAFEAGFYDQAHFIKEFRSFTGETPTSFVQTSLT